MKKLIMIISLMMSFSMMVAPVVMADTVISSGGWVELVSYNTIDNAGIMKYAVSNSNGGTILGYYESFCIQDNVNITPNTWYLVASVSDNVGYVSPNSPAGAGPLQGAVDYLFYRYKSGTGNYDLRTDDNQASFQKLLWSIQGTGPSYSPASGSPESMAQWYIDYSAYNIVANGLQQHS